MTRALAYLRRNALGLTALFVALSGVAWAASLPRNSVGSRELADGQVKSKDVRDNGLLGDDVKEASLKRVPTAAAADDSARLGGVPPSGYVPFESATIPSGATVTGAWRVVDEVVAGGNLYEFDTISLPGKAPAPILAPAVNFASGTPGGADNDSSCGGSVTSPTAPGGRVCLYLSDQENVTAMGGYAVSNVSGDNLFGFTIRVTGTAAGLVSASGSWAYTAP